MASPSLLDMALDLSEDMYYLSMPHDVAVAAETQQFQGWKLIMIESTLERTNHSLVTGMLIELGLVHLPQQIYAISAVVAGAIAAGLALQGFPWHPTPGRRCHYFKNISPASCWISLQTKTRGEIARYFRRSCSSCGGVRRRCVS